MQRRSIRARGKPATAQRDSCPPQQRPRSPAVEQAPSACSRKNAQRSLLSAAWLHRTVGAWVPLAAASARRARPGVGAQAGHSDLHRRAGRLRERVEGERGSGADKSLLSEPQSRASAALSAAEGVASSPPGAGRLPRHPPPTNQAVNHPPTNQPGKLAGGRGGGADGGVVDQQDRAEGQQLALLGGRGRAADALDNKGVGQEGHGQRIHGCLRQGGAGEQGRIGGAFSWRFGLRQQGPDLRRAAAGGQRRRWLGGGNRRQEGRREEQGSAAASRQSAVKRRAGWGGQERPSNGEWRRQARPPASPPACLPQYDFMCDAESSEAAREGSAAGQRRTTNVGMAGAWRNSSSNSWTASRGETSVQND